MPAFMVNVGVRKNPSKYKDLHAVTWPTAGPGAVFPAGKSATGHNVPGNSLYTQ